MASVTPTIHTETSDEGMSEDTTESVLSHHGLDFTLLPDIARSDHQVAIEEVVAVAVMASLKFFPSTRAWWG